VHRDEPIAVARIDDPCPGRREGFGIAVDTDRAKPREPGQHQQGVATEAQRAVHQHGTWPLHGRPQHVGDAIRQN
jgi:hypothetical protein